MRCSTLRGTFCSLITLATPRQDWTGSNPSRREGRGCGSTLSRLHSCCAVRLVYTQISPGHIWTILYVSCKCFVLPGKRLCDKPVCRPQQSYWIGCVIVCDLQTSRMRRLRPALCCCAIKESSLICSFQVGSLESWLWYRRIFWISFLQTPI
jgi:hypothetical protein